MDHFTPRTARPYLARRPSLTLRVSVHPCDARTVAHSTCIRAQCALRNTGRKSEREKENTDTQTPTPTPTHHWLYGWCPSAYSAYTVTRRDATRRTDDDAATYGAATGNSTEEVYAPSEGCTRRGRSWWRRRQRRRRRRRYGGGGAHYIAWRTLVPVLAHRTASAERYSRLR